MEFWQKFWEILFWISLPIMGFLIWRIVYMEKQIEKQKKQIQRDLHSPEMEETRHFLKPDLKRHGIKTDEKFYEEN